MSVLVIEGRWEEIRLRDSELAGRRVKVFVLDEQTDATLRERLTNVISEAEQVNSPDTPVPGPSSAYDDALLKKYRRQGFRL